MTHPAPQDLGAEVFQLGVTLNRAQAPITDAELMRLAVYSDSPAERSMAVLAWGNRQFAAGSAMAQAAHSHVVDRVIARQVAS